MIYLCQRDDLPEGGAKGFVIREQPVFAVRRFGEVFAYHNRCPHLGIELEWLPDQFLDSSGELIQCATHGALFTMDSGLCIAGPCTGEALDAIAVVEEGGAIYLLEPVA